MLFLQILIIHSFYFLFYWKDILFSCDISWLSFPSLLLCRVPPCITSHSDSLPLCLSLGIRLLKENGKIKNDTTKWKLTHQRQNKQKGKKVKEKAQETYTDTETHSLNSQESNKGTDLEIMIDKEIICNMKKKKKNIKKVK